MINFKHHALALVCFTISVSGCDGLLEGAGSYTDYPVQETPCDLFDTTNQLYDVWLGRSIPGSPDKRYRIPEEYFKYPPARKGTMLLRVRVTDFAPYTDKQAGAVGAGSAPQARILIAQRGKLTKTTLVFSGVPLGEQEEGDLERLVAGGGAYEHGLWKVDTEETRFWRDAFVSVTDGEVTDLIMCVRLGSVPYPNCSHHMQLPTGKIKMSYSRIFLPDWQNIHDRAEQFLDCAFVEEEPIQVEK